MSQMSHHNPSLSQSQSLRTPQASPRNMSDDAQSVHNKDRFNHKRPSNSGNSAHIGQDSRGTPSPSALFSTRSPSITERPELSVQTSQDDPNVFKSTPPGGPIMDAPWGNPTNNMNEWPNRLFTTSPPTSGGMQYEFMLPVDQQDLASIQSLSQQPIQTASPVFQPPPGVLELFNLRVWEDCRGNNPNYWETVYEAVLDLQKRYGELVVPGASTAKEPRYKCGVCNHRSVRNPSRNKETSQRRWDLSPHILTHARSPIKPWFSACGKSYGRSHDQRRHSENCSICKNEAVAHSAPQEPTVFSHPPVPASRPFAVPGVHHQGPFAHSAHQHIQRPVANQATAHISGRAGPSVGSNQYLHPSGNLPSGSERTFGGHHMTNEAHRGRGMWTETVPHHPTSSNVGNAVMPLSQQTQLHTPFSPIEQPSGHCFAGSDPPSYTYQWPNQEKVSNLRGMLSSCDDLSMEESMEKSRKKTRCYLESNLAHRRDYTAIALCLVFASAVFYFGLRWYLLG